MSHQTRDVYPKFVQCWPTVCDADPTLTQPCVNVLCLHRYKYVVACSWHVPIVHDSSSRNMCPLDCSVYSKAATVLHATDNMAHQKKVQSILLSGIHSQMVFHLSFINFVAVVIVDVTKYCTLNSIICGLCWAVSSTDTKNPCEILQLLCSIWFAP